MSAAQVPEDRLLGTHSGHSWWLNTCISLCLNFVVCVKESHMWADLRGAAPATCWRYPCVKLNQVHKVLLNLFVFLAYWRHNQRGRCLYDYIQHSGSVWLMPEMDSNYINLSTVLWKTSSWHILPSPHLHKKFKDMMSCTKCNHFQLEVNL